VNQTSANEESSAARAIFTRMGISEPWQAALLLPATYDDMTRLHTAAELSESEVKPLRFRVASAVSTSGSGGVPRATLLIVDSTGAQYRATIFGNARDWAKRLTLDAHFTFLATAKMFGGELRVTLKEMVEPEYMGSVRPTYPTRRSKQSPALVRSIIRSHVPAALSSAVKFVTKQLEPIAPIERILEDIGCPGWTLSQLIEQAHAPVTMEYAVHARRSYLKLAALGALARLHLASPDRKAEPIIFRSLPQRIAAMPYKLTQDQDRAIHEIAGLLRRPVAARCVIAGDVGVGKTGVASLAGACVLDADPRHRAMILAPNATLAAQFQREFEQAFPDIASVLVTADTDVENPAARMVFGTSAVLFRDLGKFSLVVIDEQQNWSRAQREHYVAADTHLIELSATCIPRTQALVKFGKVAMIRMTQCHAKKNIRTRLWEGHDQVRTLMKGIQSVVAKKRPVIVVYPKREVTGADEKAGALSDRYSIEAALPRWEKLFPGRVRAITSDDDADAKKKAIADLEEGRADLIIATTVVQVGLNIRGLRNIVIVHPERHGITALHQLRGRVARHGGDGFCELLVMEPIADKARARLDAVVSTCDGFELAELDLALRGTGDMGDASETQSGADQTFLFGIPLTVELIEKVRELWSGYLALAS